MAHVTADQATQLSAFLEGMTFRQRLNLLMSMGVPADILMGTPQCTGHAGWRLLPPDAPLSFEGDVLWCAECKAWHRQ